MTQLKDSHMPPNDFTWGILLRIDPVADSASHTIFKYVPPLGLVKGQLS